MVVMDRVVDREKPARREDELRAAVELLKKSAPPSLTFTPEEFDAYNEKLERLGNEYQV
jgi:hypothetical protein